MEHVAAIMVLVGCMQNTTACREVPSPVVAFETMEECQALLPPAMGEVGKVFKSAYGKCAEVDPALIVESAVIEWAITPAGKLEVSVTPDEEPYAVAGRARPSAGDE
ncbi:hypothetical protein [Sinorhizobium terangae]|uniref:Uncharacterized protein n=1 Tax=Sinorhizobium terangae TaxID=110322 RepID=A0A6N7LAZ4_SINTE|nr:hypothetical protein [Sinorhizobium terangae]MBB4184072.1 hypothetical protein [Sinorhizobium terangae]MQX14912.1 hypothetical protein [Sinorhizobium terangae]WFU48174.1 hypothetical protein QA637_01765 [Sinorhizobium terangae]